MAKYEISSPWHETSFNAAGYLDYFSIRPVPSEDDDPLYEVHSAYTHRPDLLSYKLYGTTKFWWVFSQRNMDVLKDPVYDLVAGVKIYIPKPENVRRYLGS